MNIDFARLNHILIPTGKPQRDRLRAGRSGRMLGPLIAVFQALTTEGRFVAFVTLVTGAFGIDTKSAGIFVLFAGLQSMLLVSLAVGRYFFRARLAIHVSYPRRVAVGEELTFTIACTDADGRARHGVLVRGPFLPWDGTFMTAPPRVISIPEGGEGRVEMKARFVARGTHHLDSFSGALLVPLGLSTGRSCESNDARFVVVPRQARVRMLALPVGRKYQPGGVVLASKSGESMDLLGIRPYRPGDPARDLHPRSWARTGIPMVREYQQEYFTRIGIVLDTDISVASRRTLEAAIRIAAGVLARISRGEALIDVLVLGTDVHSLTMGRSLGHMDQALDLLGCVESGPQLDVGDLLQRLSPHLEKLSCVVFIALREDDPRRLFQELIEQRGVACRTIVVDEARTASVEREEALVL